MKRWLILLAAASAVSAAEPRSTVRATGEGIVSVRPDQAIVSFAVVTQAPSAQAAAAQNATKTQAVLAALKAALGTGADLRTSGYSLQPNYHYPREGGTPVLNGFTAANSVEATISDITTVGKVLDAGIKAGANRIDQLRLTMKDAEPHRREALRLAGQRARSRAEAIAAGLGAKLGKLVSAEESGAERPIPLMRQQAVAAEMRADTPIEPGQMDVRASVTVEYELAGQ